jgi:hypothetical protein
MAVSDCFALDPETARRQFLVACRRAGVTATPYFAPRADASPPQPIVEVVRFGDPEAKGVLALTGGSWKDEGLCASGVQTAMLYDRIGEDLPPGVGLVLVHAIAPEGLSGLEARSRAGSGQPKRQWTQRVLAAAESRFARYISEGDEAGSRGERKGIPWQAQLLCRIADSFFGKAHRVALLDIRTGPGNYGDAEIFACSSGDEAIRRAAHLFGTTNLSGGPETGGYPGEIAYGLMAALERTNLAAAVLEFGTYSMRSILAADKGRAFYPDTEDWREFVWRQSRAVTRQALRQLADPGIMPDPPTPS